MNSDVTERVNYITKHIGKEIYLNIKKPFDAIMAANESTARDLLIDFKGKDREYFYNNSNSLDPIEIITNPNSHNLIPEEFIFHENIYGYKVDLIMDRLNYKVIKLNNKFETSGLNFEFKRDQLQAINREMQNIRFDMQIEAGNSIYYHFERISYKILNTITSDYSNFMTETVKIIDITLQIISNIFNL